jgi:prepilin-type processing-associated H-X9-DG protein
MIQCLVNQKNLVLAWHIYAGDNNDRIVNGYVHESFMRSAGGPGSWVEPPQDETGNGHGSPGENVPYEYRERGYRAGLLFGYLDTVDVLRCPKDMRYKKGTSLGASEAYQIFRTYSIPDGASANKDLDVYAEGLGYRTAKHVSKIQNPSSKYIMVEESYDGKSHNYNDASFNIDFKNGSFWDPLRVYHNNASTIGFADAHAENYKYKDPKTVEYFLDRAGYEEKYGDRPSSSDNEDVLYFIENWPGIFIK